MCVSCVEHLKECRIDEWNELFCSDHLIIKQVVTRVFQNFKLEREPLIRRSVHISWEWHNMFTLFSIQQVEQKRQCHRQWEHEKLAELRWKDFTVTPIKSGTSRKKRLNIKAEAQVAVAGILHSTNKGSDEEPMIRSRLVAKKVAINQNCLQLRHRWRQSKL